MNTIRIAHGELKWEMSANKVDAFRDDEMLNRLEPFDKKRSAA